MLAEVIDKVSRKARNTKDSILRPISCQMLRKRLQNTDFTVISSNCIGAKFYQELKFPYNTPFVGLFINAPCYIKLIKNLDHYLQSDITFVTKSKYEETTVLVKKEDKYPIGLLGGDIEIHFQHYHNETEAREKWSRRIQRMNKENLFITFTDRDHCTEEILYQFDKLPYIHKVCFTAKKHLPIESSIWIKEYQKESYVGDLYNEFHNLKKHFDFVNWLNGGVGRKDLLKS